jgi:hypothetical protein
MTRCLFAEKPHQFARSSAVTDRADRWLPMLNRLCERYTLNYGDVSISSITSRLLAVGSVR